MAKRTIRVTLKQAKEWYNSDNATLKEIALKTFSEKELNPFDFTKIKTFDDALDVLNYSEGDKEYIKRLIEDTSAYSKASAAMFMLNIVRKALNTGYDLHLTKNVDDHNYIWYPYFRFITEDCTYYKFELENGALKKIGKITSEGVIYDVLGGCANNANLNGLGYFNPYSNVGHIHIDIGLLGCATEEIAKHFGRYFGMLIMEAMYGDMVDFAIVKK